MKLKLFFLDQGLYLAWGVSLVATLGSLYLSEIEKFIPCTYCWYQRILMYPLVVILGIAAVRRDYGIVLYALPLSIGGMGMAGYHYMIQKTDWFASSGSTCSLIPCDVDYLNWLGGVVTIPFLALIAFTMITIILFMVYRASKVA